jgi:hypothetical protein
MGCGDMRGAAHVAFYRLQASRLHKRNSGINTESKSTISGRGKKCPGGGGFFPKMYLVSILYLSILLHLHKSAIYIKTVSRDSAVGIATGYGLDD